jgi:hypothetical protein
MAAIPARDWALTAEPSIGAISIGIAFHQWADLSWALVFLRNVREMDCESASRVARGGCRSLGHLDLVARMVRAGTVVSVLAADVHIATAILDRVPGPFLVGIDVPAVRLALPFAFRTAGIRRQNFPSGVEPGRSCRNPPAWDRCAFRCLPA